MHDRLGDFFDLLVDHGGTWHNVILHSSSEILETFSARSLYELWNVLSDGAHR